MLVSEVGVSLVLMKIKMISWNVRGLNDPQKRLVVKNLLREWKCDVVCLQEMKIASMNRQLVCSLWSCPYVDWSVLEADRIAGGILLMWDKKVLEKLEVFVGTFSVSVKWQGVGDGFIWACSGVYAQMRISRGVTCGMSWWVFSSIGGYRGAALEILILFVSLVSVGVRHA